MELPVTEATMTTNAYLFMWNQYGIEAIVPITQYEEQDKFDTWNILKGDKPGKNPLDDILMSMQLRISNLKFRR